MSKLAVLLVLLGACVAETELPEGDEPQAGSVAAVTQALTGPNMECDDHPFHVNLDGWRVSPRLPSNTPGVGRPWDQKLLSPQCPTCPLLWVYPVQSTLYLREIQAAEKRWDDALGWNVVDIDLTPPVLPKDVPTYGTVISMNGNYDPPAGSGGWFTAGVNTWNWYRQNRDGIFINLDIYLDPTTRSRIIAHEIGHSLIRGTSGWHAREPDSLMYATNSGEVIHSNLQAFLIRIRRQILNEGVSQPCALRNICP